VDRFDYYTNQLRENGVYFSFSGVFHFGVRPGDRERIRWFDELFTIETSDDGTRRVRGGATSLIYWPGDVQDLYNRAADELLDFGKAPVLMEPVVADITIRRNGQPAVVLLDHEGCPTSKTLAIPNNLPSIDGKRDSTMYYLISY
jgi:hypothetical protein